jgi:hypothetical protein
MSYSLWDILHEDLQNKIINIRDDIVVKDKEKKKKEKVNSKSKFKVGRYFYHYDNNTTIYNLCINITKVTKCYIWVDVNTHHGNKYSSKIWINKSNMNEYISFSIFTIWSNDLIPF